MSTSSESRAPNFAAGPARCLPVPPMLTRWEQMLSQLELTERDAYGLLQRPGTKALRLRLWIEKHCDRFYVPLCFLDAEQMERSKWAE